MAHAGESPTAEPVGPAASPAAPADAPSAPRKRGGRLRRTGRYIAGFYWKAYEDNLTGLSAMVAYNLLLSVFPLALLALFIAGRVLESSAVEQSILADLHRLFPSAAGSTLTSALDRVRDSSTELGIVALISSIWIGASFWGALDTAFCRIYHVHCRSWLEQKRFALVMLIVVLFFMAATVAVPTAQSILVQGASDLPFGLAKVPGLVFGLTLAAGLVVLFTILCVIYWAVPGRQVPWRAVWPGALAATFAIGVVDWAFPFYLSNISTITRFGTTFVFVVIVLIWFYLIAIIMLGGATINAMRFEYEDTGEFPSRARATGGGTENV
jgi:YihY family inner membrane protein